MILAAEDDEGNIITNNLRRLKVRSCSILEEIMFIDSHAHLDDSRFDGDRDISLNLKDNDIELVINIRADLQSSIDSLKLADKYDNIYATIGVHPHSAKEVTEETLEEFRKLAKHPKVVYRRWPGPSDNSQEIFRGSGLGSS